MDLSKKQASKMSLISLFQTLLSVIAFVFVTYILLNIDIVFEKIVFLSLDIVIIGFMINGIFTFIKSHKES